MAMLSSPTRDNSRGQHNSPFRRGPNNEPTSTDTDINNAATNAANHTEPGAAPQAMAGPTESTRTVVSLLLFIHLFCVHVVLSSSFAPSELQRRLVRVVSPYTKTLHLDPNFVPVQLTTGEDGSTRLHQWQILVDGQIAGRFPDAQSRIGFNRERQDMYAQVAAYYAADPSSEVPPAMARALFAHFVANDSDSVSKGKVAEVRCVRYIDDADIAQVDADHFAINVVYTADAWLSESGEVNVLKRTEPRRSASPVNETESTR